MYYVDRLNNGQHPKGRKRLAIGYDFMCAKQPWGSLHCGYYTCKHLRITGQYMVNCENTRNNQCNGQPSNNNNNNNNANLEQLLSTQNQLMQAML
jgi:hypothetical protein